jgi:predicted lysophospholipase L1 biosynthesis ABC-type transport system permease subunit
MLRALGYRRSLVQRSFLMESSFIAVIGLVIGALVEIVPGDSADDLPAVARRLPSRTRGGPPL